MTWTWMTPFARNCRRSILQISRAIGWFILTARSSAALQSFPLASRCQTNTPKRVRARRYAAHIDFGVSAETRGGTCAPALVVGEILAGKQGVVEAELGQISNASRIE